MLYISYFPRKREKEKKSESKPERMMERKNARELKREREILEECARCCVPAYVCVRAKEIRARMRGERKLKKREK